ncbi:bifunctional 3-(3-hydroxy-phenyl)propionate/3-hydroxycinnamic acid hydroxylase [Dyella sp. Tek66A03]|uniref:bifunctional 3-(3-hydroxy-phenyl)propionate/3-hydroxycinnamic acid hydroxylase n=1 Tax=Dyella sp. Tek66A03 TaxID=3458298 RepID=UPI00403ED3C8
MNARPMPPEVSPDVDVLLVGLGPVGAALANLLGRYGVHVLAIDRATEVFAKPRAIALDNEALRILQLVGLSEDDFPKVVIPQVKYHSPLFGCFARINTARTIDGHPMLVTFCQPELEAALRRRLANYPSVEIQLGVTLDGFADEGSHVQATLKEGDALRQVRARYLVGADGASSLVRRLLGMDFEGRTFGQDWLIVDALDVPTPIDHVEFLCDPHRPTPHMVAPGGRQRWEFMLRPGEQASDMEQPERVRALLAPWCETNDIRIERTAVYRFHAREARRFSKGRCFLVGDAAHVTPPFAGQGLVAGLRDAANLAWKLAGVVQGRIREQALDSYDQERRPHARKIINLARFLGRLVMPSNRVAAFAVHGLIRALRLLPAGRAIFDDLKIKPPQVFGRGLFWRERNTRKLLAGSMFPQTWVRQGDQLTPLLSDDVLGLHWSLIGFGVDLTKHLDIAQLERLERLGGKVWQWCSSGHEQDLAPAERRLEAMDKNVSSELAPIGWIALVRPDRCVMAEGPLAAADPLLRRALQILEPATPPTRYTLDPEDSRTSARPARAG